MLSWFSQVVGSVPEGTPESVVSGAVLASLAVLIFVLWSLTRLFKR